MTERLRHGMQQRRHISDFSVIVSFIALALLGCVCIPSLPVRMAPSTTLPALTADFTLTGAAPLAVDQQITGRLEAALARIAGVKHIRSTSAVGAGHIEVEFDRRTDMAAARLQAAALVRQAWPSMPQGASYPVIALQLADDDDTASGQSATRSPFMSLTLNADRPLPDIGRCATDVVKPALDAVDGLAEVSITGVPATEWLITYRDADAAQIQAALQRTLTVTTLPPVRLNDAGNTLTPVTMVSSVGATASSDSLRLVNAVVRNQAGRIVTLGQLAKIERATAPVQTMQRIDGLNSVFIKLTAAPTANQVLFSQRVRNALQSIDLPAGYRLDVDYDAAGPLGRELADNGLRTALTLIILLVFVAVVTRNWRYLALVTVSLIFNLAISVVFYRIFRVEIQLYTLAAIAISLNLVIDNVIVMTEHVVRYRNLRAFMAVLAATLTTIGAMAVIFFVDDSLRLRLQDFVIVVAVNLAVSLAVSLLLVPALVRRLGVKFKKRRKSVRPGRLAHAYCAVVGWVTRHRVLTGAAFVLAFGLPVFMLPHKLSGSTPGSSIYNATIGTDTYNDNIRPWVDAALGGAWRLFAKKVEQGQYLQREVSEPTLTVNLSMPDGSTIGQIDNMARKVEAFISGRPEISHSRTAILNSRRAVINISFKPAYHGRTGELFDLKGQLAHMLADLGGLNWSVSGLDKNTYNTTALQMAGILRVRLDGYDYDRLKALADTLSQRLATDPRVANITVTGQFSWFRDDYSELLLNPDLAALAADSVTVADLQNAIAQASATGQPTGLSLKRNNIRIRRARLPRDFWSLMRTPVDINGRQRKLADYAQASRTDAPATVVRNDQAYVLCLQYDFAGPARQGEYRQTQILDRLRPDLPLGYRIKSVELGGDGSDTDADDAPSRYWLLAIVALIIFFITAILFNSLRQPLAVICTIPVALAGVFMTFYLFELKFDSGGFAAMILLSGLTVNAAIYILNHYRSLCARRPRAPRFALYMAAFRAKIRAIALTVLSTVLGFMPFIIDPAHKSFWFTLAAATVGGLLASAVAILLLLPAMTLRPTKKHKPIK